MITKEELINQLYDLNNSVETGTFIDEDLSDTNLSRIDLSKIIFKRCNFYVSSLCSCKFTECEFLDCNFQSANLLNVTFKDCNIVNNNFTAAKLQDVLIEGGFKTGNNFTNVNIVDNVKGLSQKDLNIIGDSIEGDGIFSDKQTKNDEGQLKQSLNVESAQVLSRPQTLLNLINTVNRLSSRVTDLQKKLNIFPEK